MLCQSVSSESLNIKQKRKTWRSMIFFDLLSSLHIMWNICFCFKAYGLCGLYVAKESIIITNDVLVRIVMWAQKLPTTVLLSSADPVHFHFYLRWNLDKCCAGWCIRQHRGVVHSWPSPALTFMAWIQLSVARVSSQAPNHEQKRPRKTVR